MQLFKIFHLIKVLFIDILLRVIGSFLTMEQI